MGFGYLFIGYLITFVLYLTVQALGLGGLALLLGYATMLLGLVELTRYQRAFSYALLHCGCTVFIERVVRPDESIYTLLHKVDLLFAELLEV